MANWQRHIYLQPEWGRAQDGEISTAALAGVVAKRLRQVKKFGAGVACSIMDVDDERDELADEFESLSRDPEALVADFDELMSRLFDWGDQPLDGNWNGKKVCWIDTIGTAARKNEEAA